jgi:hypothetical protein
MVFIPLNLLQCMGKCKCWFPMVAILIIFSAKKFNCNEMPHFFEHLLTK